MSHVAYSLAVDTQVSRAHESGATSAMPAHSIYLGARYESAADQIGHPWVLALPGGATEVGAGLVLASATLGGESQWDHCGAPPNCQARQSSSLRLALVPRAERR